MDGINVVILNALEYNSLNFLLFTFNGLLARSYYRGPEKLFLELLRCYKKFELIIHLTANVHARENDRCYQRYCEI